MAIKFTRSDDLDKMFEEFATLPKIEKIEFPDEKEKKIKKIFKKHLQFARACGIILRQYTRIALFFCAFFAVTRKKVRKQVRDAEGKKLNFGGN
mgnify:CR=1 FL=1